MILGVVSNCWSVQLPQTGLSAQCRLASESGFGYVELRQRALAECEEVVGDDPRPWPVSAALARLRSDHPALGMNLALELPFFTEPFAVESPYLTRCIEAAQALSPEAPLLRFVDLSPAPTLLSDAELEPLASQVAALAVRLWQCGVRLALENSKQPVERLLRLIEMAETLLPAGTPAPQVCWDAHNQIVQMHALEDPVATARSIDTALLFEYHFKQARNGTLQGDVDEGEIDWRIVIATLHERGFRGPALFEIPSGDDAWERLTRSAAYIRSLARED